MPYGWNHVKSHFEFCFIDLLILFRMGIFSAAHRWRRAKRPHLSLKSVSDILSATIILYLKKIKKIYKSRDTPLSFADISIFSLKIINFCYIKKYGCISHFNTQFLILLFFFFKTFFWVFKGCFNKHDYNSDDVSKIGYFRSS